jgi:protein CpxP
MNSPVSKGLFSRRTARKSFVATAFLAALLSLGVAAFAQDQSAPPPPPASDQPSGQPGAGRHMGGRPMMSVDDQVKHLSKKLNLSSDQQAKLKPILEDQRTQMEAAHNDASLSKQDRMSKMQDLRKSSDEQIKAVLNPDQQKNFDKMRAEQQEHMKNWHKGGDAAPPAGDSQQ